MIAQALLIYVAVHITYEVTTEQIKNKKKKTIKKYLLLHYNFSFEGEKVKQIGQQEWLLTKCLTNALFHYKKKRNNKDDKLSV